MGGPNISTLNNASQPGFTQPGRDITGNVFGFNPGRGGFGLAGMLGQSTGMNRPSPLSNQPAAGGQNGYFGNLQQLFGSPVPSGAMQTLNQMASGPNPGQAIVDAYRPIFERNVGFAEDTGPRFSSGNELLRTQSLNDYNMFAQQALQQGQQRQLQAAMGAGQLGLESFMPLMQQFLQTLFTGGGLNSGPIYNVSPGFGQQLLGAAGSLGGALLGGGFRNPQQPQQPQGAGGEWVGNAPGGMSLVP